ncbi:hypothetical protein Tco_0468652 [Tanacetum coccineum]
MAALKFAKTHNLVAFLEKPIESEGFEEIVDFLNANPIKYALTVNPTIYCSCIKQFWDTIKAKTVIGEIQLQALVDKKKKKQKLRKSKRKDIEIPQSNGPIEPIPDEAANEKNVPTHSNDPLLSDDEASLGDQEDASKQGRKILDIDVDKDITLDSTHFDIDPNMFRVHDLHGDEVFVETKEPVVNVATTTTTTATTTIADEVEMTLAQTLIEIKSAKPRVKGIVMQEPSESTPTISSQQPSQVKGQGSKDKEAIRLQAHFDEEARVAREKEEANAVLVAQWNDIQDKVETDYELAQRLRKFFAAKKAEEKRNRPPTKAQQRSIMCTYLKNMEGWKPKDLKTKSFSNLVEGTKREESSKRVETIGQESSSKREGDELEQEKAKKQNIDDDQEEAKMKELMKVVSDEEGVAINAIPLSTKPPSIVDYKIIKEGKISIYQIIRADGSSKRYSAIIHMLRNFNREDSETLWKIVKARHGYTRPKEGYKRVLWG